MVYLVCGFWSLVRQAFIIKCFDINFLLCNNTKTSVFHRGAALGISARGIERLYGVYSIIGRLRS